MTKLLSSTEAQMSLGFGGDIPTERLFFAVMPDAASAARIAELADGLRGALPPSTWDEIAAVSPPSLPA